ncbi:hypothetical protein ACN47E_006595 [Coniothyrium glycines]
MSKKRGKRKPTAPKPIRNGTAYSLQNEKARQQQQQPQAAHAPTGGDTGAQAAYAPVANVDATEILSRDSTPVLAAELVLPSIEDKPLTGPTLEETETESVLLSLIEDKPLTGPTLEETEHEENILPSIEDEPLTGQTTLEENVNAASEQDESQANEAEDAQDNEDRMDWSPTPAPQLPVQPTGTHCLVICRLSSQQLEPATSGSTLKQRVQAHNNRRVTEGLILAQRLAQNCPAPVTFSSVESICVSWHSDVNTDWTKGERAASAYVKTIRGWFERPQIRGSKVTVLVRAIDGITTSARAWKSFLEMVERNEVDAQLIFQYNKVCDEIRPLELRNFMGLGGTCHIQASDFLDHVNGKKTIPGAQRILDIWYHVGGRKALSQGIQYRNRLPRADLAAPEEVPSISSSVH